MYVAWIAARTITKSMSNRRKLHCVPNAMNIIPVEFNGVRIRKEYKTKENEHSIVIGEGTNHQIPIFCDGIHVATIATPTFSSYKDIWNIFLLPILTGQAKPMYAKFRKPLDTEPSAIDMALRLIILHKRKPNNGKG